MSTGKKVANTWYDCVILGSGIKESILAGLLSASGLKVLQMDSSASYGSSSRTLRYEEFLLEMQQKFPNSKQFHNRAGLNASEFYIDLTPKIFLAAEGLVQVMAEHNLSYCIDFSLVGSQYIVRNQKSILIPNTRSSILMSRLCGPIQMYRMHKFMRAMKGYYEASDAEQEEMLTRWETVRDVYAHYGISKDMQVLLGHGVALYTSDAYLQEPPREFLLRLVTYFRSLARVNGEKAEGNSPFLYPRHGMSEISQAFARLSAVRGGTTRMATDILSLKKGASSIGLTIQTGTEVDEIETGTVIANDQYAALFSQLTPRILRTLRAVYVLGEATGQGTKQALIERPDGGSDLFLLVVGPDEGVCPPGCALAYLTGSLDGEISDHTDEIFINGKDQNFDEKMHASHGAEVQAGENLLMSWKYSVIQTFSWVDTAYANIPCFDSNIIPLLPMDSTVDFRTVHLEVQKVLSQVSPSGAAEKPEGGKV